jgi:hypothetical protein
MLLTEKYAEHVLNCLVIQVKNAHNVHNILYMPLNRENALKLL